ncbi:hypothetical protein MPER_12369, partial [Moniliophthora perniciosa FA553]
GVTCSPISALGLSGNSCNAQTVCCENNSFHGRVALRIWVYAFGTVIFTSLIDFTLTFVPMV